MKSIGILQQELNNYEETCKKIDKNNMYSEERDAIQAFDSEVQRRLRLGLNHA